VQVAFNGAGVYAPVTGDVVKLYEGSTQVGTATLTATDISNGYVNVTSSTLTVGSKSLTAKITDAAGNTSNASSVLNLTLDTTAPALSSATVSGTRLVLTYTEAGVGLASTTPAASSFSVSKNGGTAVSVSTVDVDTATKTVTLTLASTITNADSNIQVAYTPPASNLLQDVAGNTAVAFSGQTVTNNSPDTTPPSAPGLALTTASDTGTSNSDNLTNAYIPTLKVSLNGTGVYAPVAGDVAQVYEGSTLVGTATLAATDISNGYVNVTSAALTESSHSLTATLTDAAGNTSNASSALAFTVDTTAPVFASAAVNGSSLVLSYTEASSGLASTVPAASSFTVSKNGGTAVTVSSVAVDTTTTPIVPQY
jgi:uncharacterized repeat protein (TIGR02059 family)